VEAKSKEELLHGWMDTAQDAFLTSSSNDYSFLSRKRSLGENRMVSATSWTPGHRALAPAQWLRTSQTVKPQISCPIYHLLLPPDIIIDGLTQ
jgi:hypothetical protein